MNRLLALLPALLLAPTASADRGGIMTSTATLESPRVAFRTGGAVVVVVVANDACDGQIGEGVCGDTPATAWAGETPHDGLSATAALTASGDGPALTDGASSTLLRQTSWFQSAPLVGLVPQAVSVTVNGRTFRNLSIEDSTRDESVGRQSDWDTATDDTYTVSVREKDLGDGTSVVEVKVKGLAKDEDLRGLKTVSVAAGGALDDGGSTRLALGLAKTRAKLKMRLRSEGGASTDGQAYAYDLRLLDANGELRDRTGVITLSADPNDEGVVRSKTQRKRNGDLKHVAWTISDDAGADHAFDVAVYDSVTGDDLIVADGEAPAFTARYFEAPSPLAFDADAVEETFSATLTARDAAGDTVGAPYTFSWSLSGASEDGNLEDLERWSAVSAGGITATAAADGTFEVALALTGGQTGAIAGVELVFNEPFEGASPQDNPVSLAFEAEVHKWVHTASLTDAQGTGDVEVDAFFYDSADALVERLNWEGAVGDREESVANGGRKLNVVKAVKSLTGLGLKEA